ncbi:zinc finger protein 271 isoform X2 [Aricia agestis]|uniref:zinc finger protein 271 isoform X2 n=1 Tax=Aricia agestis TaxID=91739 RepID=UPI001C205270|nr:zinc finger protein 271 isoform X2 [Aricia agestis]
MSVDEASLPCPICLHTGVFDTVQSLKDRLIFVSTNNIMCPVCQEEVSGLDKLTIHLFSHVKILTTKEQPSTNETCRNYSHCNKREEKSSEHAKKSKTSPVSKNKPMSRTASPVKYVKIYPKLPVVALNTVPLIDISAGNSDGCSPNNQLYLSTIKSDTAVVQTHKCNICGLQFVDENILNMHKSLVHNLDDSSSHSVTRYDCHLCPKNFKMRGSLMVHLRVAHFGFSSNISNANQNDKLKDNNEYIQSEKLNELERQDGKQWQCDVCRKCFTTKYFLKKHKRLHTGETPYACTQCNKTFTFQQSYHKHLLYHNDEKPHTCSFCGRSFKELSTLHNHQRIHTGEKPFACESCDKECHI